MSDPCAILPALRHQIMQITLTYRSAQLQPPRAIQFTKTVGADLHIRPTVLSCKIVTALRYLGFDFHKQNG